MYFEFLLISAAGVIWWVRWLLREENGPAVPQLFFKDGSHFAADVVNKVTLLKKR